MKRSKILAVALAALLLLPLLSGLSALPTSAVGSRDTTPDDDCFTYESSGGGVTVTGYSGSAVNVAVPTSVKGTPVTAIADGVFASHGEILRVYLPEGLQSIGAHAFEGCTSLLTLTLPDSLTSVGEGAFSGCTSLYDIDFGDGLRTVGARAFRGCSALSGVTLPRTLTALGAAAFADCAELSAVVLLSDTAVSLPADLLDGSPRACVYSVTPTSGAVTAVTLGSDAEVSYTTSFSGGVVLTSCTTSAEALIVPQTLDGAKLVSIGDKAFSGNCPALRVIVLPDGIRSIGDGAMRGLENLCYIRMPDTLDMRIDTKCFEGCVSLRSMIIPDGVASIDANAFFGCSSLTTVSMPATLTRIMSGAFSGCTSLSRIYADGNEPECQGKSGTVASQAFGGVPADMKLYTLTDSSWSSSSLWHPNGRSADGYVRTVLPDGCFYVESSYREATCHTVGARVFTCPFCGESFSTSIPKTEHQYVSVIITDGYETFRCLNCESNYIRMRIETCTVEPEIALGYSGADMIRSLKVSFGDTVLTPDVDYTYEVVYIQNYSRLEVTVVGIGRCNGSATWGFSSYTGDPLKRYDVVAANGADIDGLGEYYRDDRVTLAPAEAVPENYEVIWTVDGVSSTHTSGNSVSFNMPAHAVGVSYVLSPKPVDTTPPDTEPPVTEPPVTEPPVTEPPVTEPPVTEPYDTTTRPPYGQTQQGEQYLRTAVLWGAVLFASLAAVVGLCIAMFRKKK